MKKKFTKEVLKDGMVVEYRDGDRFLVLGDRMINENGFNLLSGYDKALKDVTMNIADYDIVKVYRTNAVYTIHDIFNVKYLELIWERSEKNRMTAEEMQNKLEELTGDKIEIEPSIAEKYWKIDCYCNKTQCSDCCLSNRICTWNNKIDDKENVEECYKKIMEYEK